MQSKPWQSVILIIFSYGLFNASLAQQTPETESNEAYPSEQLLEFLADFGEIDEQTFELIEYHALQRDRQESRQKPQEKSDDE
jgi:hypothetical protein